MRSNPKWLTVLIVIITLGLVFGPVFVPREVSRWYLAAAHNAFRKQDSVLADHYLKQAEAWDPSVTRDGDYWIAQLPKADLQSTDQLLDLIERAVMADSRWKLRATEAAEILSEEYDFQHAVRALKIASLGQRPTTPETLNHLAYNRALAGIELDEALKDIDRAIDEAGPLPSLLDTKAWVLHGLKRNLEALGYMNEAIQGMEQEFDKARIALPKPLEQPLPKSKAETPKSKDDGAASDEAEADDLAFLEAPVETKKLPSIRERQAEIRKARRRIGEAGFVMAVLRFHRMRILESLKHTQEAAEERRWLEERGVPVVDELF